MARQHEVDETDRVRIPAELNAKLDRFFSELKRRVLDGAVRRAAGNTTADGDCIVENKDLLVTAQAVLAEARSELDQAFLSRGSQHVRRAS